MAPSSRAQDSRGFPPSRNGLRPCAGGAPLIARFGAIARPGRLRAPRTLGAFVPDATKSRRQLKPMIAKHLHQTSSIAHRAQRTKLTDALPTPNSRRRLTLRRRTATQVLENEAFVASNALSRRADRRIAQQAPRIDHE